MNRDIDVYQHDLRLTRTSVLPRTSFIPKIVTKNLQSLMKINLRLILCVWMTLNENIKLKELSCLAGGKLKCYHATIKICGIVVKIYNENNSIFPVATIP